MPEIRSFPRTRNEPRKRILLIPIILMVLGYWMLTKWWIFGLLPLQFFGAILSLTGALVIFLVGMVFADLWASHRRSRKYYESRRVNDEEKVVEEEIMEDPFEEAYGDE